MVKGQDNKGKARKTEKKNNKNNLIFVVVSVIKSMFKTFNDETNSSSLESIPKLSCENTVVV